MTKKKILIVDDEAPLSKVLKDKFESTGFEVLTAKNGEEGLMKAVTQKPDLILLDIVMPRLDGMTMLKKLREDEWGKGVEVILLTNLSDNDKVRQALKNNVYDYLIKSNWKLEDLVIKVKEKLEV
ncbi:response regulator [bacterium]|jgi:DNA-binding response OmpR family regulator|nr:response regulator [bacterium]MBT4122270.1 response regulator [bacterium]MBT4335009.1 response regulator [bacterium]MBT4495448.1 response regulator [bacterium]MBT4763928.1 response regulator [bacterium]